MADLHELIHNQLNNNYRFLNLSLGQISFLEEQIVNETNRGITDKKQQLTIIDSFCKTLVRDLYNSNNYSFIINYLNQKKVKGVNIFFSLDDFFSRFSLEMNARCACYLIDNYLPISSYFVELLKQIKIAKQNSKTIDFPTNQAEILFDFYCDKKNIVIDDGFNLVDAEINLDDSFRVYLNEIKNYPLLSLDEEIILFSKYKETHDEQIRKKIIESNLRLVISIAKRFFSLPNSRVSILDLIQEGNMGLMMAVDKYNLNQGYKFSTYATYWIKMRIFQYLHNNKSTVKVPARVTSKVKEVKDSIIDYISKYGEKPSDSVLEKITGMSKEEIDKILQLGNTIDGYCSIDMPIGDEKDATLADIIKDESIDIEDAVADEVFSLEIKKLLDYLSKRERKIIEMRFGFVDGKPKTLGEIGKELNLSAERVRQLIEKTLQRLRKMINSGKSKKRTIKYATPSNKKYYHFLSGMLRMTSLDREKILSTLTEEERDLFEEKFGVSLLDNNDIKELEDILEEVIMPKIKREYTKIYYRMDYYFNLFTQNNMAMSIEGFYCLNPKQQMLLLKAYGNDLENPLSDDITYDEELIIINEIIPKMKKSINPDSHRNYKMYKSIFEETKITLSMPYLNLLSYLYPEKDFSSYVERFNENGNADKGLEYLMSQILTDEEMLNILNVFKNQTLFLIKKNVQHLNRECNFTNIIANLRKSPHISQFANYLDSILYSDVAIDRKIDFYKFFTKNEIEKLAKAILKLDFNKIFFINRLFNQGLSVPIMYSQINPCDYNYLLSIIEELKLSMAKDIETNQSISALGNLEALYRYCDYIFGGPVFVEITNCLSKENAKVLITCLSKLADFETNIMYASKILNCSTDEIIKRLIIALQELVTVLTDKSLVENLQSEINIVLKLVRNESL